MLTLCITDRKQRHKIQTFCDNQFTVLSHSGLHATEELLVGELGKVKNAPKRLLVAGNRTGVTAMIAASLFPECEITCHAFDLHHARAIRRNLFENGWYAELVCDEGVKLFTKGEEGEKSGEANPGRIRVACTASIPSGPYDLALMMFTHGLTTTELAFDQMEDIHKNLREGGVFIMASECDSGPLFKQDKAIFGGMNVVYDRKGRSCVRMTRRGELKKPRDFSARFPASLPGMDPVTLISLPGVFCHRRPDNGGLALAEVAAGEVCPKMRVLDMGCGCGLVGCLLARKAPGIRVTFVDSHARALAATRRNAESLGLKSAAFVLADEGYVERGFDLFVGNPPYYSDFKIADVFLETAFATLHRGGVCFLVAKTANALTEHQREIFGSVTPAGRRGYQVLKSVRMGNPRKPFV